MRLMIMVVVALTLTGCDEPRSGGQAEDRNPASVAAVGGALSNQSLITSSDGVLELPFAQVIAEVSGKKILPAGSAEAGLDSALPEILDAVSGALDAVLERMNAAESPVKGNRRINEASRHFEDALLELLDALPGFSAEIPPTAAGERQRSGYPDLRLVHERSGRVAYLDPKLYEATSEASALRTFYFTPRTATNKVLDDAYHLLLGISHDGNDGHWRFLSWKIVDLSRLNVRLKPEFQASNRDLYTPSAVVRSRTSRP